MLLEDFKSGKARKLEMRVRGPCLGGCWSGCWADASAGAEWMPAWVLERVLRACLHWGLRGLSGAC
jgi:hypothetical protein